VVGACFVRTHGNVTEDGQENVDEEVGVATTLEEDTQRWEHDGEDNLADVAGKLSVNVPSTHNGIIVVPGGERHAGGVVVVLAMKLEVCIRV
jgi:hypothetical protein